MSYSNERLGDMLVDAALISPDQLEEALSIQAASGGKLGEVLVRGLILTEEDIAEALAGQKGLDHVNLASCEVDSNAATMIPLRIARREQVVPIAMSETTLTLAMADPLDVEAVDEVEYLTGLSIVPVVASASQVRFAIEKYIAGMDALRSLKPMEDTGSHLAEHDVGADAGVPVIRMVNQLLREAVMDRASDIHFEPGPDGVRVRYRVDGVLREVTNLPTSSQAELLSRLKVMADLDISERSGRRMAVCR